MSAQTMQAPNLGAAVRPYRLTVRRFQKAVEAGVFPADARIELLGGIPVEKMTSYPPHNSTVYRLVFGLRNLLAADWIVLEEKPIVTGRRWRPMPDLAVVRGPIDRYLRVDPATADVALVVEVADSSYPKDRGPKWRQYASEGLPAYWIVNIEAGQVEVYTDPEGRGVAAGYRTSTVFKKGQSIPVAIDGDEVARIDVDAFLP